MPNVAADLELRKNSALGRRASQPGTCSACTPEAVGRRAVPGLPAALADASVEAQGARFNDTRLPLGCKRAMAGSIGRTQGNHHFQKVVASLKRAASAPPDAETVSEVHQQVGPAVGDSQASRSANDDASGTPGKDRPPVAPRSKDPNPTDTQLPAGRTSIVASNHTSAGPVPNAPAAVGPSAGRPQTADSANDHRPEISSRERAQTGAGAGGAGAGAAIPAAALGAAGESAVPAFGPAAPAIDSSSTEGLLASIASSPVSGLEQALGIAKAIAPGLQQQEKARAQAAIPAINQPTGLPAMAPQNPPAPTSLPQGRSVPPPPAAGRATPAEPPLQAAPGGPLPASQLSTVPSEPRQDPDGGGGSWWNWLVDRLQGFFGSLPTSDPNVSTSAGPPQRVDMSGESDPAQNVTHQQAGEQDVAAHRTVADVASRADFGENAVYPTVPVGKLKPAYQPAPAARPAGKAAQQAPVLPAKERAEFDHSAKPWLDEQIHGQLGVYGKERGIYERATEDAQQTGKRELDDETKRTRAEQETLRKEVHADVAAERGRWQEENRKIQQQVGAQSSAKRQEIDRQINEKVAATHREADTHLQDAETKAEGEKAKSEKEATDRKRDEESKPRSWWDRVKGAVSDAFNAIRSAVNAIFDKLRQVVKGIIDTARRAVHALIEACRSVIVGMIHTFGEFVKGLVSVALAAFPELAKKARAWIDGKVKAASDAVNRAAEALHRAADAILDAVAKAIDTALGLLQTAFNKAIDVLEKLALLPFQAMETLAKLVQWVAKYGKFVTGALDLEGLADQVIEGLKKSLGAMVSETPAKAHAKLQELAGQLGGATLASATPAPAAASRAPGQALRVQREPAASTPAKRHVSASDHLKGIRRYLEKGLDHLKIHWWDELKKVGWNLLWPWPAVWGDLKDIWKQIKTGFDDAYHLRVSKVIDDFLAIEQKINSILGNLYGWFFIASVLVGAIIGAFFGGVGAIPGALAGAAFAGEVGEALVAALIVTESAVIVKSVADLAIGNDKPEEDEQDYSKIGGSTLTVGITLAMMLIGEIAAKLAKSVWEGVTGLFRGEKGPEIKVPEGGASDVKPADHAPGVEGGRALAEAPTGDGATIKALDDGRVVICRSCEISDLASEFSTILEDPANEALKAAVEHAKTLSPAEKVAEQVRLRAELERLRVGKPAAEPLRVPTPEEHDLIGQYTKVLQDLRAAREAGDPAGMKTANDALQAIEDTALEQHGKGGSLDKLLDHLDTLTKDRTRLNQGEDPFGTGVASNCAAAKFGPFRGQPFSEVERAIGRPPDQIEGAAAGLKPSEMPTGAVRATWEFGDGSRIDVDIPGSGNTSPYMLNRQPHLDRISPEGYHLDDAGIGVPARSTPAHIEIEMDPRLREIITGGSGK
ncbi:DUF6861 domain-containing protein [Paraburkholderia aromaticivorans]|uniref:DUF6861 domain-containing protein n=1 Tax=Paraburkholderia aromaticivorans TaxID=2026199 RepID=UPI001455E7A4|nr:hypothetical protein [Paraburkholderia aromaticivorans]